MHDSVIPLFSDRLQRKRGWSNQDLAELYRIEDALVQAGIAIDTETGETEEGDPWFVLCSADTCDVLVHVAVIDRQYCMASNWTAAIHGHSLADVVQRFMSRHPAFLLGLNRGDNVLMHPSSIIVAVLSAVCLVAEEHNREIFGPSARDKALRIDNRKADHEIFNIADHRQLSVGDFTFSPQQAFIILSAIAFSASPFIQQKASGLPATVDVINAAIGGTGEADGWSDVTVANATVEDNVSTWTDQASSRDYAVETAHDRPEQVGAHDQGGPVFLPNFGDATPFETREADATGNVAPEWTPGSIEETVTAELVDDEVGITSPEKAGDLTPDALVVRYEEANIASRFDKILVSLGYTVEVTDAGVYFDKSEEAEPEAGWSFISFDSLDQLALYYDVFQEHFGVGEIVPLEDRWIMTNDAAQTAALRDMDGDPAIASFVLDEGFAIQFHGFNDEIIAEYALIA